MNTYYSGASLRRLSLYGFGFSFNSETRDYMASQLLVICTVQLVLTKQADRHYEHSLKLQKLLSPKL